MGKASANGSLLPDDAPKVNLQLYKKHQVCLVLDFGSQYTQLIARRVREQDVYSMLLPGDVELVNICRYWTSEDAVQYSISGPHVHSIGRRAKRSYFEVLACQLT